MPLQSNTIIAKLYIMHENFAREIISMIGGTGHQADDCYGAVAQRALLPFIPL
jgi:hypothetical protein